MDRSAKLDENYWSERYRQGNTPWDLGSISTPLKAYIDQLENKQLSILIPGCGNGYEAEYLFNKGFKTTYIIDIAQEPILHFKMHFPEFPDPQIIHGDFFNLNGEYDLIIEQTFFCALHPEMRKAYVSKMKSLLKEDGKLIGVLFDAELNQNNPPYGGNLKEYKDLFSVQFNDVYVEKCHNSIGPRQKREVFINISNQK